MTVDYCNAIFYLLQNIDSNFTFRLDFFVSLRRWNEKFNSKCNVGNSFFMICIHMINFNWKWVKLSLKVVKKSDFIATKVAFEPGIALELVLIIIIWFLKLYLMNLRGLFSKENSWNNANRVSLTHYHPVFENHVSLTHYHMVCDLTFLKNCILYLFSIESKKHIIRDNIFLN